MRGSTRTAGNASAGTTDRGVVPATSKLLETGLLVLVISLLATTLYGGVVPAYRDEVATEVSNRVVSQACERIRTAAHLPDTDQVRLRVSLPPEIAGDPYRISGRGRTLVLDHPRITRRTTVTLPTGWRVRGTWESDDPTRLRATRTASGGVVVLERGR